MDSQLAEYWEELSDFIISKNSIDIGALRKLFVTLFQDSSLEPSSFSNQAITFLQNVSSQTKKRSYGQASHLSVLALDSEVTNLYLSFRNGDFFQPNNSMDFGWISSSQMSMDHSNLSDRETQLIPQALNTLANSQSFFKKLNNLLQKSQNHEKMKRYIESLLQTLDFILSKEHFSRDNFLKFRGKYIGLESRKKWEVNYDKVNSVIFSAQLNKVVALMTQGNDQIHLALLRIYLAWQEDSNMYEGVKFNGQEMLINLYRYYISSFRDVDELFQEGKHPILRFLKNHLTLLFTPVLRKFHQLVLKLSPRCGNESGYRFFKNGGSYLETELVEFINELPNDLLKLLMELKDLVQEQHPSQSQYTLLVVKKMLFYSFLLNQPLIQELYPRHDPSKLSTAYNNILNLFFQSSIKKYSHLPQSQQNFINKLIQLTAGALDNRIANQCIRIELQQSSMFKTKQSIINHDFELILFVLSSIQFTPKDSKHFQMRKPSIIAPESPVYRHFKSQGSKIEQSHEELQLAAWMSVGGSCEWKPKESEPRKTTVNDRLRHYKTIDARTRSKLLSQSRQWCQYMGN